MSAAREDLAVEPLLGAGRADGGTFDVLYRHRYRELDGLRGVASFIVGITHALEAVAVPAGLALGAGAVRGLGSVLNGGTAVDLFFVMSGFFLFGMIAGLQGPVLLRYYLRRLSRLAPPAIFSVAVFYLLLRLVPMLAGPGAEPRLFAPAALGPDSFRPGGMLLNLLLVRHTVNTALWTIRIEIFISLLFPFLLFFSGLLRSLWERLGLLAGLTALAYALRGHQKLGLDIFHYLYIFYAGALMRQYGAALAAVPGAIAYAGLCACMAVLLAAGFLDPFGASHPFLFDCCNGFAGAALVGLAGFGRLAALRHGLAAGPLHFMGRISYSFYLVNILAVRLVIFAAAALAARAVLPLQMTAWLAVAASLCLSLLLASALNIAVEQPAVALSRYLGRGPARVSR